MGKIGSAQVPTTPPSAPSPLTTQTDLTGPIRKSDTVRVVVAGADQLGGDFRVDEDGSILIPRIGQLTILDKMPVDAARAIAKQIQRRELLSNPSVAVYIIGRKAREVLVNGAVNVQGRQVIKDNTQLSEALETSVPLSTADLSRVSITRANGTELKVNYKQYRNGISNATEFNPPLEDGDRIYIFSAVPPEGTVRVLGEVKDATKVVVPILQGASVGQVLQSAGGVTEFADRDNIVLLRGSDRIPVKYNDILKGKPDSDPILKDGDEIIVPHLDRRHQYVVAGAVRETRPYPLTGPTTLLDAVGEAGGPQDGAQQNKIELRRRNASGQLVTTIKDLKLDRDASTEIQDGDYIFIPFGKRRPGIDVLSIAGIVSALAITYSQLRH
jgi:protein involved in polysaccharide export with SLBB domain